MDAFEKARHVYEKNKAARERSAAKEPLEEKVVLIEPQAQPLKSQDATIHVHVILPDVEMRFSLVKPLVYQNVNPSKLTRNGIINGVLEGLKPILGGMKAL